MTDGDPTRCTRDPRDCAGAETTVDPLTQERTRTAGEVQPGYAFCPPCVRQLRYALSRFPLDCAELTTLLVPSMAVSYADPDMPSQHGGKKHPPLPMNGNAEALRALIDHEVTCWAESTAEEAGVDWSSYWSAHSRLGSRVQVGCQLLEHRLDHLLGLPAQTHPCRSTGEHPTDGHDPDDVTFNGRDYWVERDGTDAALLFLDLHRLVERFVGRAPADRCPVPCPQCKRQTLYRVHPRVALHGSVRMGMPGHVLCRGCWTRYSDTEYEELTDITAALFGVRL